MSQHMDSSARSKNSIKKRLLFPIQKKHFKRDSGHEEVNSFMAASTSGTNNINRPELSPNVVRTYQRDDQEEEGDEDDDPSYDNLVNARSTPILFSNNKNKNNNTDRYSSDESNSSNDQSIHSAHSSNGSTSHRPPFFPQTTTPIGTRNLDSPSQLSTKNHIYYFGTPLSQKPPSSRVFGNDILGTTTTTNSIRDNGSSSNRSSSFQTRKNKFRKWMSDQERRLSSTSGGGGGNGTGSIKSVVSAGRHTLSSLRMRRINLIINKQSLPEFETEAYCKHCEKYLQTRVRYRNGSMVWLMSFILLMCTVVLFWVPFYVKYFKDVSHYCPGCGKKLGTYHRL